MKILKLILIFFLIYTNFAFGYLINLTTSSVNIHWKSSISMVDIYVNSQNSLGLIESDVQTIAQNSANQWNNISRINLRKNSTQSKNQNGFNEVYFSSDPTFFGGTAVKGVTQVSYKQENGEIIEADVLIDDTASTFTTNLTDMNFVGNVITHELGHLLGMGHGQVLGSTMFYELSYGQSQLANDDKAGLFSNYPITTTSKKSITGQIIGGKNLIPVYGAQVEAISLSTGQVAAAGVSDPNGRFSIDGLIINDQYFLYTKPLVQVGLPTNYENIKNDFCEGSKSFRGSFFQSCGANGEGYPQAIKLNSANVDVGQITIRCGLDVPPTYIQQKSSATSTFNLNSIDYLHSNIGNSFVGYFSSQELNPIPPSVVVPDTFKINLTSLSTVNWNALSTDPLYMEVKIINQILYSPFKTSVLITNLSTGSTITPTATNGADGFLNLDLVARVPINQSILSDNDFLISVTPQKITTGLYTYFPSFTEFADGMYFYLVTMNIVTSSDGGLTFTPISSKNYQNSDNATCPDAINTYALTSYNSRGVASNNSTHKKTLFCGAVDTQDNSGNGPKGFLVGLTLCYIFVLLNKRFRQRLL